MKNKKEACKMFNRLDKVLDSYSGGAVEYQRVKHMEEIKPKSPTIYHVKNYGKTKVIIMLVEAL
jgi:hypothetical protein